MRTARDPDIWFPPVCEFGQRRHAVRWINRVAEVGDKDSGAEFDRHFCCHRGQHHENIPVAQIVIHPDLVEPLIMRELGEINNFGDGILIGDVNGELQADIAGKLRHFVYSPTSMTISTAAAMA